MNEIYRKEYLGIFENIYLVFKNIGHPEPFDKAIFETAISMKNKFPFVTEDFLEGMELEVDAQYNGSFIIKEMRILDDTDAEIWFDKEKPILSYFWPRYEKYLLDHKNWVPETVQNIDISTNEILKRIGNPKGLERFDKRGLVLGHVQSGKTANFTGLINKAFDIGYKLIIVLAGMHNDLRSQTQLRLEREVVGINSSNGEKQGVALVRTGGQQIETWTTVSNDISTKTIGLRNLDKPILLIVKKQKDVLPQLIDLLRTSIKHSDVDVPLLIIDDEADQASVDASKNGKIEPTKINAQIRELLELFNRKAYVGYTATPFANLLINAKVDHVNLGKDLYPKDFVIALSQPKEYCGPDEFFNTTGYLEDNKPMFIRHLSEEDRELLDKLRTKDDAELFKEVPLSMRESILAFFISIAIRELRGQKKLHNSMLIHTSRFTDVQNSMCETIRLHYSEISNDIYYNQESQYKKELQNLYETDFLEVQTGFESRVKYEIYPFDRVYETIRRIVKNIEVMEINGESEDVLNYDNYIEKGLNVIAVGGNKLSRGLTLEGLTISYYYRGTSMYDTLLQMGRWFGYRTGYMDLCRIYTSPEIAESFQYLSEVMSQLREEFDKYVEKKLTPKEYAVRMLKHPTMTVTSPLKMGTAIAPFNYSGSMQQTRSFEKNTSFYENNMQVTINFINSIEQPFEKKGKGSTTRYHIAKDIPSELIVSYLDSYQTISTARIVNSKKIAEYIKKSNIQNFNVAVVDITPSTYKDQKEFKPWPVKLGVLNLESAVARSMDKDKSQGIGVVDLGAIVAANQEFIDIKNRTNNKKENLSLRDKENPLILIYPLHPEAKPFKNLKVDFSESLVPIGLAFSFPNKVNFEEIDDNNQVREEWGYIYNGSVEGD